MKTTKFKTTIKCSGCVAKVTPHLDEALGEKRWNVDLQDPAKILSVDDEEDVSKVIQAVERAGFRAEPV